jgi:hypothetical protein
LAFFVLTFSLAVPFWVLGGVIGIQLLPGLPVAALTFVCPGLAALILVGRENGSAGAKTLLARAFDYKRIKAKNWYTLILLLNPGIFVLSYVVLRLLGTPVPVPQIHILPTLTLCVVFFVGAVGEELGWSGYAIDPMQKRFAPGQSPVGSSLGRHALCALGTGSPILGVDRLVVSVDCLGARHHGLALQQLGQERVWRGSLPRCIQRLLAGVSDPRFILRSARHRVDRGFRGRGHDSALETTRLGRPHEDMTGTSRPWNLSR